MSDLDGLKLLRRIEEGVAGKYGEAFFRQIVCDLSDALGAHAAYAARLDPDRSATMLAFWVENEYRKCYSYSLQGTPCQFVYEGRITAYARGIGDIFPRDREWFASMGVNSYLGIPIKGETGDVVGHLTVLDRRERDWREADVDILRLFSLRTAVELERDASHRQLRVSNEALAVANSQLKAEMEQRALAEKDLAAAKVSAEAASRAKSVFISQMSHELRTPLNGIMGYAQLMNRHAGNLTDQQRDGLRIIERSGEHLLALVNDLLDLAKIEAGKLELSLAPVDLADLARQIGELMSDRARRHGIELRILNDLPSRQVLADERALRQVLLNLVGNAIKFTPRGGDVRLRLDPAGDAAEQICVRFSVEDTGIGIPDTELQTIFEPFHRVSASGAVTEGTGLGLTITQRLLASMGSQLAVRSTPQRGSTFEFTLAFAQAGEGRSAAQAPLPIRGYRGERRRVLLADDDNASRDLLLKLLLDLGFMVTAVGDGEHALRAFAAERPELVVTDLVMPRLGGIELLQAIRNASAGTTKVVALSASTSLLGEEEPHSESFDAVLKKPVRFDELLNVFGELLRIEWEREPVEVAAEDSGETASAHAAVESLRAILLDLAKQGDVSMMAQVLSEQSRHSPEIAALYRELQRSIEVYDTEAMRSIVESWGSSVEPTSSP